MKLVFITNRNLHIGFQLVSKSVTLSDLDGIMTTDPRYFCSILVSCLLF